MFSKEFWKAAAERAVKTFAQSLAALLGSGSFGLWDVSWPTTLSVAAMAALISVLTSIGSLPVGSPGTPSVVPPAAV